MAKDISGNVVNKISFEIDRRSWANLDKFQKRIADVKKQLSGLSGNIKVNAVVSKFDRVQKAVGANGLRNQQKDYNAHIALYQKHKNKMSEINAMNQRRVDNARNMMSSRLSTAGASDKVKTTAFNRFDTFSQQMLTGKMTATEFSRAVNQSTSSLLRQSSASKNAQMSMRGLRSELIQATAAYSAFAVGANVFGTGKELQSLEAGMLIFAKDGAGVKREMDWLISKSQELGTNFMVAAQEYTKFSIVAKNKMSDPEAKRLFVAYSELATVQQMDPTRFHRGMNALVQMLSKGSLMSEEVKGQWNQGLTSLQAGHYSNIM